MFLWRPGLWKKGQLVVLQIEAICGSGGSQHLRERQFSFFTLWVYCRTFVSFLSQFIIFQNYKRYHLWLRGIQAFTRQFWVLYFTLWFFSKVFIFAVVIRVFARTTTFCFHSFPSFHIYGWDFSILTDVMPWSYQNRRMVWKHVFMEEGHFVKSQTEYLDLSDGKCLIPRLKYVKNKNYFPFKMAECQRFEW